MFKTHARILLLALFLALSARAQEWGSIVGTVTDPTGAGVPRAVVTVTETDTGLTRTAPTNDQGAYAIPSLRPTAYSFTVEAAGFQRFAQKVLPCRRTRRSRSTPASRSEPPAQNSPCRHPPSRSIPRPPRSARWSMRSASSIFP